MPFHFTSFSILPIEATMEMSSLWNPIECSVLVHMNSDGQADSLLINHRPLGAALHFSRLMWEQVGDRYGKDLFLTDIEAAALRSVITDARVVRGRRLVSG